MSVKQRASIKSHVHLALLLSASWLAGCQPTPVKGPRGITLHVRFQTHQGRVLEGGWVESGEGKQSAVEGELKLMVPFHPRGQHIVAQCPLLYEGATERHFSASTLSAGGDMEMTLVCQPLGRVTGLSVHSDCKGAKLFLEDQALGQVKDGWFQAWLRENERVSTARADASWLRLVARADPDCRFIDPLTQRPTSQLEFTVALSPSAQAVWMDLRGVVVAPPVRRAPSKPSRRPYRL